MECLSTNPQVHRAVIQGILKQRMVNRSKVDSNLAGPAGMQDHINQCPILVRLVNPVFRFVPACHHQKSVDRIRWGL